MSARHRVFAYCLLMRAPMAGEEEDIDEVLAWARRKAIWLAGAYCLVLALAVWPAFAGDHDLPYRVVALVGTHFLLWTSVSTVASCWVGFRGGQKWRAAVGPVPMIVGATLAAVLFFLVYADLHWQRATHRWMTDTFGWTWLFVLVLAMAYGFPELVARLRRRERAAVIRAMEAEASSEKLAHKTAESELRLLQAQVEPHFLYNTLANLRYLIQRGSPDALRMTDALIEYLRTAVPDIRALRVTLGREVDHARHYLEIMQMRMGSRLVFEVDVPEALRAIEVPPLLLLTLVENAVKHGIAPHVEGGEVVLSAHEQGGLIRIEVADTGVGALAARPPPGEAPSTGVGLDNLRGRLQLVYGQTIEVELVANVPRGTRVRLRLPREMPRTGFAAAGAQAGSVGNATANGAGLRAPETRWDRP
ncbi:MAG TPA: histidine kinase [Burkholderiaceae bacterium]|nr:histidine kinase [Burkholderiaceae bacterium]